MIKKQYTPKQFAELVGRSVITLQRWDREGTLTAYRTPTNRRYYTHEQYLEYMGIAPQNKVGKTVIYARVSSASQKDGLVNQVDFLQTYANAKGIIVDEIMRDVGSGLNYNRKKFNEILFSDDIKTVLVAHKDRWIRFGFDWFERFLQSKGIELVIVNCEKLSPQEELVEDLISIIHAFSYRIYGLRKYKKKVKEDESLQGGAKADTIPEGNP